MLNVVRVFKAHYALVAICVAASAGKIFAQVSDPQLAIKKFEVAPGLKVELFAAEPLLQNPVAFSIDEKGRFFVAETHRYKDSIFDITTKTNWLLNDLSFKTVSDRAAFLQKTFSTNIAVLTNHSELIRLIEDRDGDGRAETSSVFADGFQETVSGTAAGILARHGEVWFTCIPDLWKFTEPRNSRREEAQTLTSTNKNEPPHVGSYEKKEKLHTGYGVHIGVTGHDLHGLRMGPDGKIYFSSGDRGFSVKTKEGKVLDYPNTGGVLRCNPDGSELEVFCSGLRNPQDLVFDEFGNLWTDDNDTSGSDESRLIYCVEGADYGWRNSYQYAEGYGPWVQEELWKGRADGMLPAVGVVSKGPAGLAYYPGTGLPEKFKNHFFACDFPQGIWSFTVKTNGASFELEKKEHFLWHLGPTKIEFGPDSDVYVSDWGQSYPMPNAGRIYRVFDPAQKESPARAEVKKLLADGMEKRSVEELAKLLGHSDMRVRLEAQFEIEKRRNGPELLGKVAAHSTNVAARLHAVWGLGNSLRAAIKWRKDPNHPVTDAFMPDEIITRSLTSLLHDKDVEVRIQTVKMLGEATTWPVEKEILPLLNDENPRVRFFAAMSLGKLKNTNSIEPILQFLRANDDQDPYLTHAGVFALTTMGDFDAIQKAAKDNSWAVRRAALLCLRRMKRPEIQQFLISPNPNDAPEPHLFVEAARAINDVPIEEGTSALAAWLEQDNCPTGAITRSINANFRGGTVQEAVVVASFAKLASAPEEMRVFALEALSDWGKPGPLDRVTGAWRPLPARDAQPARDALSFVAEELLAHPSEKIVAATVRCARKIGFSEAGPRIFALFQKKETPAAVRVEILDALAAFKNPLLADAVKAAMADTDHSVQRAAIKYLAKINPTEAAALLGNFLKSGSSAVPSAGGGNQTDWRLCQAALSSLGEMTSAAADEIVARELDNLLAGKLRPELQLDLIEAARKHAAAAIQEKLKRYTASWPASDPLANFRGTLAGGDAARGRKIFHDREDVACLRCHAVKGKGGTVGPDLAGVASRQPQEYLLESILLPNKQIAAGFENITVTLTNGGFLAGMVKSETETELVLNSPEDGIVTLKKKDIQKRERGMSSMPEGLAQILSQQELRDLIAYLETLK